LPEGAVPAHDDCQFGGAATVNVLSLYRKRSTTPEQSVSAAAVYGSVILLAAGYGAHALWDLVHHPVGIRTPVRRNRYPLFCVLFDLVAAAFILVWLV